MNRFFGCVGLILALILGLFILSQAFISTTYGEVRMVQPNGIMIERDNRYSETNLNNSQANENNAQANKINAQATQIATNTNPSPVESFSLGASCGVLGLVSILIAVFVALSRSGALDK